MGTILDVRNLRISFRTAAGTVKAVRDISFALEKGETLAIVGESGSGKSVTSKAIMGIEAMNAINEGGEIFYDGMDLLKISEEEFHDLRGNRIAMVFQDPLSSLNPIMKVGTQLTEAMILNGKANQRDAKAVYTRYTALLEKYMEIGLAKAGRSAELATAKAAMKELHGFIALGNKLALAYNNARTALETVLYELAGVEIEIISGKPHVVGKKIQDMIRQLQASFHTYVIPQSEQSVAGFILKLKSANKIYMRNGKTGDLQNMFAELKTLLQPYVALPKPNYFAIGYCVSKGVALPSGDIETLNRVCGEKLENEFLKTFKPFARVSIQTAYEQALAGRREAVEVLNKCVSAFERNDFSVQEAENLAREAIEVVKKGIDELALEKDSVATTFPGAINLAVSRFARGVKLDAMKNVRGAETKMEKNNVDLPLLRSNILNDCVRIRDGFAAFVKKAESVQPDFDGEVDRMIAMLHEEAGKMVYRVTREMAYSKAISLMEEVGISEARIKINQYPFQFSGGMRQRIVIAIALAANPDILICDEPTTALDVTIQSQILELINRLKKERNLSIIFITHDLGVVANMADKIAVMYAGKIVEYGTAEDVFYQPCHPYTWALLASMPDLDSSERLEAIPGTPPNMIFPPKGDAFAARNRYAMEIDFEQEPPKFAVSDTHWAATWLLHPDAPKVEPPKTVTDRIKRMAALEEEAQNNG